MFFSLRYYQEEAVDAINAAFESYRSTALILPTATGKTECYLALAVANVGRALVLVHRDYLISSPIARLAKHGFTDVAVEKADDYAEKGLRRAKVVFASVQSIGPERQERRLTAFNPKDFSLLVIDEGHRATSATYRRVKDYFEAGNPKLKTLILTATPKRSDGIALGNVCESVAYEMTPATAAAEGWIAPPRFFTRDVPELDYSQVRLKGVDLDPDQLAELLMAHEPLDKVCASLVEFQGPTIVFCPKVAVAQVYAARVSETYRLNKAVAIHKDSTEDERERATRGLMDGSVDFVMNVDVLTEGYDVPRVVRVAWVAPTASLVRWTQGCGRGFRPDASVAECLVGTKDDAAARRLLIEQSAKPYCEIVTYYPSNCRHQICTAVDLLGGTAIPDDLKKFALQVQEQTSRQGGGSDTEEDIETAAVFCNLRSAVDERLRHVKARATVVDTEYDGMGGESRKLLDAARPDVARSSAGLAASWGNGKPASDKQQWWLRKQGLSPGEASACTAWRAHVVRELVDLSIQFRTAWGYGKSQALAVAEKVRAKHAKETAGVTT